ncbi:heterokaryon incompatibility protein-domain-containing protein, partial [Cercophora newfieldiana]
MKPKVLSNGETVLIVYFGLRPIGAIRRCDEAGDATTLRQIHELEALDEREAEGKSETESTAWKPKETVDPTRLRRWLDDCDETHTCLRQPSGAQKTGKRATANITLIDVVDGRLVPANTDSQYFALSYIWGGITAHQTLSSSFQARSEVGALKAGDPGEDPLPATIRDAMTLVREMGYRYLWVDSLCIVQDDGNAKHEAIRSMDLIYSKAYATLGDLCIHTPPPLVFCIDLSPWNTRAWTFQEKLLSRRCLYFSKQYVYLQCGESVTAE